jgi:hypothetical protein
MNPPVAIMIVAASGVTTVVELPRPWSDSQITSLPQMQARPSSERVELTVADESDQAGAR